MYREVLLVQKRVLGAKVVYKRFSFSGGDDYDDTYSSARCYSDENGVPDNISS